MRAKSTCIIAARISLETPDEPISETAITDAPKHRAFSTSELVECGACSRSNPPTRASCLYCGAALEVNDLNAFSPAAAPNTDASADVAFHVAALAPPRLDEAAVNEIAGLLQLKPSDLQLLLTHSAGAPLLMATSEQAAQIAATRLEARGVTTEVFSDERLALDDAPKPISALRIHSDKVLGSVGRTAHWVDESWANITLIVIGRLYFATKEIDHRQSRSQQVIDEREMSTDDAVVDVYFTSDAHGWRIRAGSFDFSCLSERKQLTAFANFRALIALLRQHASAAAFDESYVHLRVALNSVWPPEPTATTKERGRTAFRAFDSSVTSIDNEIQFTRYSRLLRHLYSAKLLEDHAAQT
ncbi:MAG TPA: hypothetical protein VGP81_04745 [Pyrinomonadaceae bacterium]|nr:hypothetical protein [Pyrinomonadaceae bacterium]